MGKYCYCCMKVVHSNPNVSFHRFPADSNRRVEWLRRLGFEDDINLPKYAVICSDHFDQSSFIIRPSGMRAIRSTALPLEFLPNTLETHDEITEVFAKPEEEIIFIDTEEPSSKNKVTQNASSSQEWEFIDDQEAGPSGVTLKAEHDSDTDTASENGDTPSRNVLHSELIIEEDTKALGVGLLPTSSPTVTASEVEEQMRICESDCGDTLMNHRRQERIPLLTIILLNFHRNEDKIALPSSSITSEKEELVEKRKRRLTARTLTRSDFSTPEKAEKYYVLMKNKLERQTKKIGKLEQTVRQLKRRVKDLTSLVSDLKQKCSRLENAK